jgi:hypothetical protein
VPAGETQMFVAAFASRAAFSRPCCRSPCAPWIETLPNTATAPVAAIAIARERPARSSLTATCGTALVTFGASKVTSASNARSGSGSNSSSAHVNVTIPTIAACGAASRTTTVAATQSSPASVSRRVAAALPVALSFGVIAASGSRERMSRSGLSTAMIAASIPPTTAITTLGVPTTRDEPTANAEERKPGFAWNR